MSRIAKIIRTQKKTSSSGIDYAVVEVELTDGGRAELFAGMVGSEVVVYYDERYNKIKAELKPLRSLDKSDEG